MSRATRRALTALLTTSGGCADWPRFANLPEPDAVVLTLDASVAEEADWPDSPDQLPATTQSEIGTLWQVTRLDGTLSPFGQEGSSKRPYECAADPAAVAYSEDSDIDWVHLQSEGGALCLLLGTDAASSSWDAVLHVFDPGASCVSGPFLNPRDGELPQVTTPNVGTFVPDVPAGPLALYVAGALGEDGVPGADVPYTLYVVPATVAESCTVLRVSDMTDLAEAAK